MTIYEKLKSELAQNSNGGSANLIPGIAGNQNYHSPCYFFFSDLTLSWLSNYNRQRPDFYHFCSTSTHFLLFLISMTSILLYLHENNPCLNLLRRRACSILLSNVDCPCGNNQNNSNRWEEEQYFMLFDTVIS